MTQARVAPQAPAPRPRRECLKLGRKAAGAPAASYDAEPAPMSVVPSAPRLFPLGRLRRADENVRHTRIDEGCEELAIDIMSHGLLQSLIGYEDGDHVEIVGGGRRLKALRIVRDRGRIDDSFPVPVLIRDVSEAVELSLAENLQQRSMSPVDEFLAFSKLMEGGATSPAELAKRFGFSERVVKQRLKMAELAKPILDALANREITLDSAMAYASADDQALQAEVFAHQAKRGRTAHDPAAIRLSLRMKGMDTADRIFRFVGSTTYEAEGGRYSDDLFNEPGRDRVLAQPFIAETIANRMVDLQAARLIETLRTSAAWAPTIAGLVKVPDLRLHAEGTSQAMRPPAGFVLIERAQHQKLWATIRNNGLPAHVVVGLDVTGQLIADPRYAFVPLAQKSAVEKPALVEKAADREREAASRREVAILRWSRRLAVPPFTGTPLEGRVFWPAEETDRHVAATEGGVEGFKIPALIFVPLADALAHRKEAARHVDQRLAALAAQGATA
ncbi:ParB/RepB/Spo0J family partition protein [Sphingomonas sp. CFBP 8760]|uniref:ParB/RepB/Spo0J family partition protein n=1 Tax=Sphingomonas sp. CFBP 8760 TaxID=2775282 RepID=UPI00177E70E8|nr:ParB/RepB/Spo0J family partition protein [Sphingomonas sp. CFBP 8760]MBD8548037.1 ParB N-terminal domain-containing protein [Sphingomonas sp. CFBP 8760]